MTSTISRFFVAISVTAAATSSIAFAQNPDGDRSLNGPRFLAPPPAPAAEPESPADENTPGSPPATRRPPSEVERIEILLRDGRYDDVVTAASAALARRDGDVGTYRRQRADAYFALGRYAEALADHAPIEARIGSQGAQLKSGSTIVATAPAGTVVEIEEVRGDWLKVASAAGKEYRWAWVHSSRLERPAPAIASGGRNDVRRERQFDPRGLETEYDRLDPYDEPRNLGPRLESRQYLGYQRTPFARPYYSDGYGSGYGGGYGGGYYGDYRARRSHDYGRRHYDWHQHVPPQYRHFLPR